jgi:hypothetical protein
LNRQNNSVTRITVLDGVWDGSEANMDMSDNHDVTSGGLKRDGLGDFDK